MSLLQRVLWTVRRWRAGVAVVGTAVLSAIEWAFAATFGRAFYALESLERVEDWLLGLVWVATWPFRLAWRLLRGAMSLVVPASVRHSVGSRVALMQHRLGAAAWGLVERLNLDGLVARLVWLLQPVWWPAAAVGGFVYAWFATRPYKQMAWGLPAVLLLLPMVAAVAWGLNWGRESVAARYRLEVKEALEQSDFQRVQLFERKLSQLGADTRLTDFNTALALAQEGRLAEAWERMERMAPVEEAGYPGAHFWLVQRLLSGERELAADQRRRLVEAHLGHLRALRVDAPQLDLIEAAWLGQTGRPAEAAELLRPHVHRAAAAAVMRMEIHTATGRREEARRDAALVRDHLQQRARRGEALTSAEYQTWALAEELLGNDARLREVVGDWLQHDPQNERARRLRAAIVGGDFGELVRGGTAEPGELASQLREAFALAAADELKQQVTTLYQQRAGRRELRAVFDELAQSADLPASLAETLGTAAAVSGEWERARALLERAVSGDDGSAVAWNNLACVLLQIDGAPLETALDAANRAIELAPDDYRFRETRGQILVRLARWEEAVADLELALNGMPELKAIHQSLAQAYEALGNRPLAAIHRQRAD